MKDQDSGATPRRSSLHVPEATSAASHVAHTPGPWEVGSHFVGPLHVMTTKDRHIVAHVGDSKFVQAEANAHLIAAAPEIRDALKSLLDRYTSLVHSGDAGHWDPESEAEVIAARLALAKAEGR